MNSGVQTVPSASEVESSELREYGDYLGVFFFLGLLLVLATTFQTLYGDRRFSLEGLTWGGALFTLLLSAVCGFDKIPVTQTRVSLQTRKSVLMTVYIVFVATAALLTIWDGGARASTFSNLLLLIAPISAYIAKESVTRVLNAVLAMIAYCLASFFFYDSNAAAMVSSTFDGRMRLDFAVVISVLVVSAHAGSRMEKRRQAEAEARVAKAHDAGP